MVLEIVFSIPAQNATLECIACNYLRDSSELLSHIYECDNTSFKGLANELTDDLVGETDPCVISRLSLIIECLLKYADVKGVKLEYSV